MDKLYISLCALLIQLLPGITIADTGNQSFPTDTLTVIETANTENILLVSYNPDKEKLIDKIFDSFSIAKGEPNRIVFEYKKINPTKYRIRVHNANNDFLLVFSESFNKDWKVYPTIYQDKASDSELSERYTIFSGNNESQANLKELGAFLSNGSITALRDDGQIEFISKKFNNTIQNDNLPTGSFDETWFKEHLSEDFHLHINGYANSWWIQLTDIKRNGIYTERENGAIDFELIVEYWPQRLFYLGLIISSLTLLACFLYLLFESARSRQRVGDWSTQKSILKEVAGATLIVLIFSIFSYLSLYEVYQEDGTIGRTWDWGISEHINYYADNLINNSFYIWIDNNVGGWERPINTLLLYDLYFYVISFFSQSFFSKVLVNLLLLATGLSFYYLLRHLHVNKVFSIIFAFVYMFNTRIYSMIIAGHVIQMMFFAFFPLIVLLIYKFQKTEKFKYLIQCIILVMLTNVLPNNLVLVASISLFLIFIFLKTKNKISVSYKCCAMFVVAILMSSYFLIPLISGIRQQDYFVHFGEIEWQAEKDSRFQRLESSSWSVNEVFSFSNRNGMDIENVNVLWDKFPLNVLWSGVLFSSFLLIFYYYFIKRERKFTLLELFLLSLLFLSTFIILGVITPFGKLFYFLFSNISPTVFSIFSNLWRWSPLLIFSWCVLFALVVNQYWSKKNNGSTRKLLSAYLVLFVGVYQYPWFTHGFTDEFWEDTTQPLNLNISKVNVGDKEVYDYLAKDKLDYRIMFIPPPSVMWPGQTKYGFSWNSGFFPKNNMFGTYGHTKFQDAAIHQLYSNKNFWNLSWFLSVANVKYLIRPQYRNPYYSYVDLGQNSGDFSGDYKNIEIHNLMKNVDQNKLKLKTLFAQKNNIDVFENNQYRPHIYQATSLLLRDNATLNTSIFMSPVLGVIRESDAFSIENK